MKLIRPILYSSIALTLLSPFGVSGQTQTAAGAQRDTIGREVIVVSDKVRHIDDADPIFFSIPIATPEITHYNPATPRSTGDFTPTLVPPQSPVFPGYASQTPKPYSGVLARLYGGFLPAAGGDLAARWVSKDNQSIVSFDLAHLSERLQYAKGGISVFDRDIYGGTDEGSPEQIYLDGGISNSSIYQHKTKAALSYAYHWQESLFEIQTGFRSNLFANRLPGAAPNPMQLSDLDYKQWRIPLREYSLGIQAHRLKLQNWIFDASALYAFLTQSLPGASPDRLIDRERMHRLDLRAATVLQISTDWALGLKANFYLRSPSQQINTEKPTFSFEHRPIGILRFTPQFQYRGFVGFGDIDFCGGVGIDLDLRDMKESLIYPALSLRLTDQRTWQWYLLAIGGLKDTAPFDFLSSLPGLSKTSIPLMDRQQLHSKTGVKFYSGSTVLDIFAGFDYYYRFHRIWYDPYASFLLRAAYSYHPLRTIFGGIAVHGTIANMVEMGGGLQYNHHSMPAPYKGISKPWLETYYQLRILASRRFDIGGVVSYRLGGFSGIMPFEREDSSSIRKYGREFLEGQLMAQYHISPEWTLFSALETKIADFGPVVSKQPYSVRIGIQFNRSFQ